MESVFIYSQPTQVSGLYEPSLWKSGVSILYNPLTFLKVSSAGFQSQTFLRSSFCCKTPDLGLSSGFLLLMENLCDCNNNLSVSCTLRSSVDSSCGCGSFLISLVFGCRRSFLLVFQSFSSIVVTDKIINTVILVCPWKVLSSESSYSTIFSNPLIMTFQ